MTESSAKNMFEITGHIAKCKATGHGSHLLIPTDYPFVCRRQACKEFIKIKPEDWPS